MSAFFGWAETDRDLLLVIAPVLHNCETFKDQQYLAISAKDLISWRAGKSKNWLSVPK